MDPKSPNVVEGGKRPFHTIIPAFLTHQVEGRQEAVMSFGVMGGNMQPQGHLQSLVRMLDYGQPPQAACDAPRCKVNRDFTIVRQFFPMQDEWLSTLLAIGTFGISLLMRPPGAVVPGIYGDRKGRKAALTLAIALMMVGTLAMAVMPPYASIGIAAQSATTC